MQILKEISIDWRERRLISNLYMAQSVKVRLNRGETRSMKIGRGLRQGCCLLPILFNLYSKYLTKEALEGFGVFEIGGQIVHNVKYADDLVYTRGINFYKWLLMISLYTFCITVVIIWLCHICSFLVFACHTGLGR
jgi:hypothetical protein